MSKMREQSDLMMPSVIHRWPTAKPEAKVPEFIELWRCKKCQIKVPKDQRVAHLGRCPKTNLDKLFTPVEKVDV